MLQQRSDLVTFVENRLEAVDDTTCDVSVEWDSAGRRYSRIIGGQPALFAHFPWQACIRVFNYQCGGVFVSRWWVVTAGYCVVRAAVSQITVFLGELDTQNTSQVNEPAPAEMHHITRKIIHS